MSNEIGGPPLATVVITTHNRPDLARRALRSALTQTLDDLEVVVVDDGSQPQFALDAVDDRVRVVRRERAGGVSSARNAGIAAARGTWITFLDDDDMLVPEMLQRSIAAATTSELSAPVAVMSAVTVLDFDGGDGETLVPPTALPRGDDFSLERKGAAGRAANSLVVPTEVMRAIGGWDEHLESFQHDDLGLRLNAVASIQGLNAPLYRMATHRSARVSARFAVIPADMERTLAKHPEAFARHPGAHAHFMGTISYYHVKAGHWRDAVRWAVRAVRLNPRDRRLWFFLGAALAGPDALRAYRRLRPRESAVSTWTLTKRRARKYARRWGSYPRAVAAAPIARVTRLMLRHRVPPAIRNDSRSVLVLCVYRASNASVVGPFVDEALTRGWDIRLWALDRVDPALAAHTVGASAGSKFPLLNALVQSDDRDRFDWIVVVDDDFKFTHGDIDTVLRVAEAAGLDLVQPAHTERSYRENEIGVRRAASLARRTTFVEIGPMFAVRRPWSAEVVPFPPGHTMGWGLELEWFDLERRGARLGIIDAVPIRHLHPVGKGYAKQEQHEQLRALLRARSLDTLRDVQITLGTWRVWQAVPGWEDGRADEVSARRQ